MAMEMKPDTVVLFINEKEGNDKRPDLKGTCMWKGEEIQISLWNNTSKAGKEYYKGKLELPFKKRASGQQSGW